MLATTNSHTAVLVAVLPPGAPVLNTTSVTAYLADLSSAAVLDVEAFHSQPNVYIVEVHCRIDHMQWTRPCSDVRLRAVPKPHALCKL